MQMCMRVLTVPFSNGSANHSVLNETDWSAFTLRCGTVLCSPQSVMASGSITPYPLFTYCTLHVTFKARHLNINIRRLPTSLPFHPRDIHTGVYKYGRFETFCKLDKTCLEWEDLVEDRDVIIFVATNNPCLFNSERF